MTLSNLKEPPHTPKQTNRNHRMPLPSSLSQDNESAFSLRNASRIMQSRTMLGDRQEGPIQEPRKMQGDGIAFVSHLQARVCGVEKPDWPRS